MVNNRKGVWDAYRRAGVTRSNQNLNDYDESVAITGWNCARDTRRTDAFRKYHHIGINHSEYDLTDHDQVNSIFDVTTYRDWLWISSASQPSVMTMTCQICVLVKTCFYWTNSSWIFSVGSSNSAMNILRVPTIGYCVEGEVAKNN